MAKSALENFKQDFQQKLNGGEKGKLHPVEFPEIGMKCFAREAITAFRKGKILNALKNEGNLAFCAEVVVNCLLDDQKTYIFGSGDKHEMMRECDSEVLERVSGDICRIVFGDDDIEEALTDAKTEEEKVAVKNSK